MHRASIAPVTGFRTALVLAVWIIILLAAATAVCAAERTAGNISPGNPIPPEGGLLRLGAAENLASNEDSLRCAVADPVTGYVWFGTSTSPGQVIKVKYDGPGLPPRRVASLVLEPGEDLLFTAAIDITTRFAYFGTFSSPGKVIKVALGTGDAAPERIGAVTFANGENQLFASVIDPAAGYAYFGTRTSPGRVVKVELGAGSAPPVRKNAVTLAFGEDLIRSAVIDQIAGYAWFGTFTLPGYVVKVSLGAGDLPPQRVDSIQLDPGEDKLTSAVIDTVAGRALFGTYTSPGRVVKVDLGAHNAAPSRVSALTFASGEDSLACASVITGAPGFALFGCDSLPGTPAAVVKVAFGAGATPPSRVGTLTLNSGEEQLVSAAKVFGAVFFGSNTQPGIALQIGPGGAGQAPVRDGAQSLGRGENDLQSAVIDPVNGYGWFGTATFPGQVVKVKLGRAGQPPQRIASLTLEPGEDRLTCAVGDIANGYAYFGTDTARAKVVKVALGAGDAPPTRTGALTLEADEHNLRSAVIDASRGYAWFGTAVRQTGKIIKVSLGAGPGLPIRIGATLPQADEWDFQSAVINAGGTYALFGTGQYFGETGAGGKIVKVGLGPGNSLPSRVSVLALPAGEQSLHAAVSDPAGGYAWFGSAGPFFTQGSVVKVAFEAGSAAPRRVGAALMNADESPLAAAMIDVPAGYAVFGNGSNRVAKIALGAGELPPLRVGGITLPPDENSLHCGIGDPANGLAWFGTSTQPGQVVLSSYSQKGFIKGSRIVMPEAGALTKVRFYSHRAAGSVRLALYARNAADRILVWQSAAVVNTMTGGWIEVPANQGTPASVNLTAGTYDLAWQVDTTSDVPGYLAGATGDGFRVPAGFGAFPATLTEGSGGWATTDETWASHISYTPPLPVFIEIRSGPGSITLVWTSCAGTAYQVRRSDNLLTWGPASPVIVATGPTTEWTDTGLSGISRRYYLLTLP